MRFNHRILAYLALLQELELDFAERSSVDSILRDQIKVKEKEDSDARKFETLTRQQRRYLARKPNLRLSDKA